MGKSTRKARPSSSKRFIKTEDEDKKEDETMPRRHVRKRKMAGNQFITFTASMCQSKKS